MYVAVLESTKYIAFIYVIERGQNTHSRYTTVNKIIRCSLYACIMHFSISLAFMVRIHTKNLNNDQILKEKFIIFLTFFRYVQ